MISLSFSYLPVLCRKTWFWLTFDTGGEVKDAALGRLLHHLLEWRCTGLFWCFSPKPTGKLDDIHRGSSSNMIQVGFAQTNIT